MAVEKRSYDATIQNTWESLMIWFSPPTCHDTFTIYETLDAKSPLIRRSATKADTLG